MTFNILISCYNIEKYLDNCLESVINQIYQDWEIIIADDGASDGTVDIIELYTDKDKRIKAFSKGKIREWLR